MRMPNQTRFKATGGNALDVTLEKVNSSVPPVNRLVSYIVLPSQEYYEEMTPNSSRYDKRSWKPFAHFKSVRQVANPNLFGKALLISQSAGFSSVEKGFIKDPTYGYDPVKGFGDIGNPVNGIPAYYVTAADRDIVPVPANLDVLLQRGLSVMMPQIKSELSLVNSLIELRDIKSVVRSGALWKTLYDRTINSKLYKLLYGSKSVGPVSNIALILKMAADANLQTQFNILPLISDIKGIIKSLSLAERRINDLITRSGRVQVRHFAFNWNEHESVNDDKNVSIINPNKWGGPVVDSLVSYNRIVDHHPTSFHMQVEYNYNYTQYQIEHARLLALMDSFGVNFNPAIVWNAIRWTFVIDWVINVSRWLDQFQVQHMAPKINIRRVLWSVTRSRKITISTRVGTAQPGYNVQTPSWGPASVVTQTAYRREVSVPDVNSIVSSGLSLREFSLGASLVIASRRRKSRR
jgi:hypothetical protein